MDKHYEAVKEILEDQIKKIVKKGDITPQELDSLYKASAIVLDFETKEAMKKTEEQSHMQGGQSNGYSMNRYGRRDSYMNGQSTHYPWFMYQNDGMSNNGNSYAPVWNQEMENRSMREVHSNDGQSNRRGVDGTGRSRDNSNAYDNAYDGAYDGAYNGSYDGSYDASTENSYRRGRDARTGRYVSRDGNSADKQRMIGKLQDMMDDAKSPQERNALQQCVDRLEKM